MSDRLARALACAALRHASAILPPDRRDWGAAMRAELQVIEQPGPALAFAAGCLWTAIRERNATMTSAQKSIQIVAILGLTGLALATGLGVSRALPLDASAGALFALLSLIYAAAALSTLARGSEALVRMAAIMLCIWAPAYLLLASVDFAIPNLELYRALGAESLAIWVIALGLGTAMRHKAIAG